MHRNSSKSLRHVGKLNEGYLSDVHTSFSNIQYDSDASSDLMESSKVLEKQFKDKYKILRIAYERRIQQLTTSVEAVCAQILGDDLIASMRTDAASSVFIPAHISETLASYLKGDRESDIQDLLERESALNIQLNRKNAIIDNQNSRLAQLQEEGTKGKASEGELETMQEKLKALEAQFSAYSVQTKEEMDELRRQKETETHLRKSLQEQFDKSQAELSVTTNTLHHSRTYMHTHTHTLTHSLNHSFHHPVQYPSLKRD
jgi:chromosome segregation ATPase